MSSKHKFYFFICSIAALFPQLLMADADKDVSFFVVGKTPVYQQDLLIAWSPFSKGHQDPRGISDDLIFAISSDCHDQPFARTALPFVAIPALSYNDNQFRIPADRLQTGSRYDLLVEHAQMVDTKRTDSGIIGLATYPTVTTTRFRTVGPANSDCPAL